jgi:hypothetical protein
VAVLVVEIVDALVDLDLGDAAVHEEAPLFASAGVFVAASCRVAHRVRYTSA